MKLISASRTTDSLHILMEAQKQCDLGKYTFALSTVKNARFPIDAPFHKLPTGSKVELGWRVQLDGRPVSDEGFREFRRDGEDVYLCRYVRCPFEKRDCDDARFVLLVDDDSHEILDSIGIE